MNDLKAPAGLSALFPILAREEERPSLDRPGLALGLVRLWLTSSRRRASIGKTPSLANLSAGERGVWSASRGVRRGWRSRSAATTAARIALAPPEGRGVIWRGGRGEQGETGGHSC